jgi:AAA15 family ATPase/GTPase
MEDIMILRFGFRNFLSFEEGVECSFESDSANDVNTLLNIKGANGAGKTNLLKALAFFMDFVANSFSLKPEAPTGVIPFYDSSKETYFFVEFKTAGSCSNYTFLYELSLTKDRVVSEKISRTNKRIIEVISRQGNNIKTTSEFKELDKIKLRKNASLISCAHQNEISALNDIYMIFSKVITNTTISYSSMSIYLDCAENYAKDLLSTISKLYYEDEFLFSRVKKFILESDIGICDIKINKEQSISGKDIFVPVFYHEYNGKVFSLSYGEESRGTQFLYSNLRYFLLVCSSSHTLLIFDELDMSLHPFLVKKLLGLFNHKYASDNVCGQMIFTAHDTSIMDELKADKSFFLNKKDNESFGYRADECPSSLVRKNRSLRTPYEQGRIGGVPKI